MEAITKTQYIIIPTMFRQLNQNFVYEKHMLVGLNQIYS